LGIISASLLVVVYRYTQQLCVLQEELDPACLIDLTDMLNGDSIEPPYPTLWADYGSGTQTQDFGEIIIIE
jgi:hypothetical protein